MTRRTLAVFLFCMAAAVPARAFTLSRFESPDSFVADPEDGTYYVSNSTGTAEEPDGGGYISKINALGTIVVQKFIGGKPKAPLLDAPKGLAVVGRTLYVADIATVKGFDKKTRRLTVRVDLSTLGARLLSGLASDGAGHLYVSDPLSNRIFKIDLDKKSVVSVYADNARLANPTGLMVNPKTKHIMVAAGQTGQLLEIDSSGKLHALKRGLTALKGLDYDTQGNVYVSNIEKGEIYKIPNFGRGPLSTYVGDLTTPANISFDRRRGDLLIPSVQGNTITTYRPKPVSSAAQPAAPKKQ
jgi:DNA-binding beta-propeller fold protein YncE